MQPPLAKKDISTLLIIMLSIVVVILVYLLFYNLRMHKIEMEMKQQTTKVQY